jgi:hypothetical protein
MVHEGVIEGALRVRSRVEWTRPTDPEGDLKANRSMFLVVKMDE